MLKEGIVRLRRTLSKLKSNKRLSPKADRNDGWNTSRDEDDDDGDVVARGNETSWWKRAEHEERPDKMIVLVLHADDFELNVHTLNIDNNNTSDDDDVESLFQLIYVNIDNVEQESILNGLISSASVLLEHQCVSSPLLCILITDRMSGALQEHCTHCPRPWTAWLQRATAKVFLLYDQLDEIEMFRLKYRLPEGLKYVRAECGLQPGGDGNSVHETIVRHTYRHLNEQLCCRAQLQPAGGGLYGPSEAEASRKALFQLYPRHIKQENEKVFISLEGCLGVGVGRLDVLVNGQSWFPRLHIRQLNPMTLYFTLPKRYYRLASTVSISLVLNAHHFLGTAHLAVDIVQQHQQQHQPSGPAISKSNLLVSLTSLDFLCQTFGVETADQVDFKLAEVFKASLCDFGVYSHLASSVQINFWLPTWLHFAAYYNLKEFTLHLLQSPAAVRACYVRNSEGLTPAEVAQHYGNEDIVDILGNYTRKIKHIEHDLIGAANTTLHHGFLANNAGQQGWPETTITTTTTTTPQTVKNIQRRKSLSAINNHRVLYSTTMPTTMTTTTTTTATVTTTKLTTEEQRNKRMVDAKEELLTLIDKFKAGLAIKTFEYLFRHWEVTYRDVLEAQISNEFQHSLNAIRQLCAEDHDDDDDQDIGPDNPAHLVSNF